MEARALCIGLCLNVLQLLEAHGSMDVFLHVFPNKVQFFEYEPITFTCEELHGRTQRMRVRNNVEFIPTCRNSSDAATVTCSIYNAFEPDSGEYWCETGEGARSNSISITVTAADVILETPAVPLTEGDAVTLSCREKHVSVHRRADFYKDGRRIHSSDAGRMSISSVSRSDEGRYKCRTSEAGESAESRLSVTGRHQGAVVLEAPVLPVTEGEAASLRCSLRSSPGDVPAVFYKDDVFIGSSSTGNMSLPRVYKSHEGLYRCNVSGAGQSAGRRLLVSAPHTDSEQTDAACLCSDHGFYYLHLVRAASTVVMVVLLLLLLTRLHCGK